MKKISPSLDQHLGSDGQEQHLRWAIIIDAEQFSGVAVARATTMQSKRPCFESG